MNDLRNRTKYKTFPSTALDSLQKLTLLTPKSRHHGGLNEEEEEDGSSFICLAAHQAVEVNQEDVALPALEAVISHCSSQPTVLTALRYDSE